MCGAWRLDQEIGRGAYGVVYLAAGAGGERAAVKVCRREDIGDERFARELRGAKLYRAIPPQEGLVRMRELVETEWGFYTVMDLADDEFASDSAASSGRAASPFAAASGVYRPKTLARVIEGEKALPLKESVSLALSLAKGLDVLQRHHLLHRDIKPGNVLYVKGQPVLSDPGLLVEESDASTASVSRSRQQVLAGRSKTLTRVRQWRPTPVRLSFPRGGASSTRQLTPRRPDATSPPRRCSGI